MFTELATIFQQGGFFMWPIAVLLFLAIAIAAERFFKLKFVYSINHKNFMKAIEDFLYHDNVKGAIDHCQENSNAVLPKIIKAGLKRAYRDEKQVEQGVEVAMLKFYPLVKRNIRYIAVIANVATLVGLLGTIFGLIGAFAAVAQADPAQKQALLASGISIAMNTTAFGLIVAIPSMMAHGYLTGMSENIFDQVDESSAVLMDMLSSRLYQVVDESKYDKLKDKNVPAAPKKEAPKTDKVEKKDNPVKPEKKVA